MKLYERLSAYAPMLATTVAAACIGISLNGYTEPVYAEPVKTINETAGADADKGKAEKKEDKTEKKGNFDKEDGTYTGTGTGFAGQIRVSVEIKDKTIVAINILEVEADDDAFFNRARGVIDKIIADQSLDVDVVSGATYSSRGIISAVKNALTGETDSGETGAASSGAAGQGSTSVDTVDEPSAYKDGTYTGTGTGFAGPITVQAVVSGGRITSIQVLSSSDGDSYMTSASALIASILSSQSTNVDTVSGATYSSVGIIEAVRDALRQAGVAEQENQNNQESRTEQSENNCSVGNLEPASPEKSGTIPYKDGTYRGSGTGFHGDITVDVVIKDQTITAVNIIDSADDAAFFNRAKVIAENIVKSQKADVDTVSGATYSSKGIIAAVKDALTKADEAANGKEDETKPNNSSNKDDDIITGMIPYKDGVYFGVGEGFSGDMTVAVVIQDKTIRNVVITESEDDEVFLNRAKGVTEKILKKQSADVDVVSGATFSSNGIIEAVKDALVKADEATNGKLEETKSEETKPEETKPEETKPQDTEEVWNIEIPCKPDENEDFDEYVLSMTVTVEDGRIVDIKDIADKDGGENSMNGSFIKRAAEGTKKYKGVVGQILEKGLPEDIDMISGATCSSNAIINGCRMALEDEETE